MQIVLNNNKVLLQFDSEDETNPFVAHFRHAYDRHGETWLLATLRKSYANDYQIVEDAKVLNTLLTDCKAFNINIAGGLIERYKFLQTSADEIISRWERIDQVCADYTYWKMVVRNGCGCCPYLAQDGDDLVCQYANKNVDRIERDGAILFAKTAYPCSGCRFEVEAIDENSDEYKGYLFRKMMSNL